MTDELVVPVFLEEFAGIKRKFEPVTFGLPFPKGKLYGKERLVLVDPDSGSLPLQTQVLARWSDQSVKWLLIDSLVALNPAEKKKIELRFNKTEVIDSGGKISIQEDERVLTVDTGPALFEVSKETYRPFGKILFKDKDGVVIEIGPGHTLLTDMFGAEVPAKIKKVKIESRGPVRSTICLEGDFYHSSDKVLRFSSRIHFFVGLALAKIDFTVWNSCGAVHPGGLWDLGDPGSFYFKDLSMFFPFSGNMSGCGYSLYSETGEDIRGKYYPWDQHTTDAGFRIYQDSSGGENWQSPNHVNRFGEVKTSFRGYRVYSGEKITDQGDRVQPTVFVDHHRCRVSLTTEYFWQNFPSSLETEKAGFRAGFFPHYFADDFEIQPGERKTHTLYLSFDEKPSHDASGLEWVHDKLVPNSDANWYADSGTIPQFAHKPEDAHQEILGLIDCAVKGDNSFFERREIIDEYGWRHFGDFFADHEAVFHDEEKTFVSHYNNQYDGLWGTIFQFMRTGSREWFLLADQLCRHIRDIDIYHTAEDRTDMNHGLFWHTEHHLPAETSTHRCFSKLHGNKRNLKAYGGGPALAHNYSTGLLLHYFLTGEQLSLDAVLELADFTQNNCELSRTMAHNLHQKMKKIQSLLKGKRQLVDLSRVYSLDGPGRGSGNALNTLLDAYIATGERKYFSSAEEIVLHCIHPEDDIPERNLLDRENRWMYTIFLKSLAKYLDTKSERGEYDLNFAYARESLVRYAAWMVDNEDLYLNDTVKLEFPNETWAAQELRKADVLNAAAGYVNEDKKRILTRKAEFFVTGCLEGLRRFGDKGKLTRPLVLLMVTGWMISRHVDYYGQQSNNKIKWRNVKVERSRTAGTGVSCLFFLIKKEMEWIKNRLN